MKGLNAPQLEVWLKIQQEKSGLKTTLNEQGLEPPWLISPKGPYPLERTDKEFHRAVAVNISPAPPEKGKKAWSQFMVEMLNTRDYKGLDINGIILLARTEVQNKKYYLVQAKAEGGALDQKNSVFLTTTIQASFSNSQLHPGQIPLWDQLTPDLSKENEDLMIAPSLEDPGIFYGKHNLLVLHDLTPEKAKQLKLPENYTWAEREAVRHLQLQGQAAQFIADVLGTFE